VTGAYGCGSGFRPWSSICYGSPVRLHAVVASLVLLVGATSGPAGAAFCVKPNGKVVAHAGACKRKETALTLSLPPGAKGEPGAPGTSQPRFRAVDANGVTLPGALTYTGELVVRIGDVIVGLDIETDRFKPGFLWYTTDGCVGAPLVNSGGPLYSKGRVIGSTAYYATGEPTMQHVESSATPTSKVDCMGVGMTYDEVTGLCCTDVEFDVTAVATTTLDVGGFVPPFHAEVEP
jgi:hypothetical protein